MRILYVAPNPPSPRTGGGSIRMLHMVRFLGQRYELDLMAPALDGVDDAERLCKPYCCNMEFVPRSAPRSMRRIFRLSPYEKDPAMLLAIHNRLASHEYAAIQIEKPAMLPYLPRGTRAPIILDLWAYGLFGPLRALLHQRGVLARSRNLLQLLRFAMFDTLCWPDIYCALVVSDIDRARYERARAGGKVLVVPNGIDGEAVRPSEAPTDGPPVILFTGDMGFGPNVDAALFLARRIFPEIRRHHPRAELHIVGRHPAAPLRSLSDPGITVTGEVIDMIPHLHAATVYVAPHFTGAGTRTKLLEAMAAGLPVVTTGIGIEGIEATHGRDVRIADDAAGLRAVTLELLADPLKRFQVGAAARRLVEQHYDWSQCLQPLQSLYSELAQAKVTSC